MKEIFDKLSTQCSEMITKRYSTSFSLGIYFLNPKLRQPIYSIYGFVRVADEIVDSFHNFNKELLLSRFRRDCFEAIEDGISLNPVLNAFQHVVNKYHIERELIELFLDSMEMDLKQEEYTPEKYNKYILGSAQVVGLMCLRVFTDGNKKQYDELKDSAMQLGSAFQKVNFLRDVNADFYSLSRTYFPNVNLSSFSNTEKRIIEEEIEDEFRQALVGIRKLPPSAKNGVYLAYVYYKKLFNKIKGSSAEKVMAERIRISNPRKFALMFDSIIRYKTNTI
ncbi:phytoene/squalene synthase family protein [Pedobacter changchengzhani]|uniref:Phytoene/squalene synthase family protein n=1 Tax=Pedobacter changchengzhani TaxID=2529274 RepID=A0A4R5MKJ6_9SPHI|nr:phytoene/squalene synthase family protein [Pedobacter changchengzhani]TDG36190.1 phytoene/squalene synthase family protein [Pedobacter changchengzhani]